MGVTTSQDDFDRMVLHSIAQELNAMLPAVAVKAQNNIKTLLLSELKKSIEYQSLSQGALNAVLGFRDGQERADAIIQKAADTTTVKHIQVRVRGQNLTGGLECTAIPQDLVAVLSLPESSVITNNGQKLDWLDWMLTYGDNIIISTHFVAFGEGNEFPTSRSGEALMFKSGKSQRAFKMPVGVSGTRTNNWFSRVTDTIEGLVQRAFEDSFK